MFFSLDVLRARKGDCLMLHFGSEQDPHLILIDGGPSDVYQPFLKPRLQKIHETRDLDEQDPLPVDVVMVSHVDDDHIKGILDLTKEQRTKSPDVRLDVTSLWHNSFDDLLKTRPDELVAGFGTASVATTAADDHAARRQRTSAQRSLRAADVPAGARASLTGSAHPAQVMELPCAIDE